jgi:hypothetical protein
MEHTLVTANNVLKTAQEHLVDRGTTYDSKGKGERSMSKTINAFNIITGLDLTEEQGWLFMTVLKAVRTQQGKFKLDNYEDGAAYFALAAESASKKVF